MADGDSHVGTTMSFAIPNAALELVMNCVEEPRDLNAMSLVCHAWNELDARNRKHVTIGMAYSTTPDTLFRRFPFLESLKLKATVFNLTPEDRGGSASPWIRKLSASFSFLKMLHLRRMIVSDGDLTLFVSAKAHMLVSLKLECCSGFSTRSLALIARSCKKLETLFVEDSIIDDEKNDEWLLELATNNTVLETLNFFSTDLNASFTYLALLVSNCRRLKSLKISGCLLSELSNLFCSTVTLQEFAGDSILEEDEGGEIREYNDFYILGSIQCLSLGIIGTNEIPLLFPYGAGLKKLGLLFAFLTTEDHCEFVRCCPNLEVLEVRDNIGDRGLEVVAQTCKKLQQLRVDKGYEYDYQGGPEDEQGRVTHVGLIAVAGGCPNLQYWAVHVSDITNTALEAIGTYSKNLNDFQLVALDRELLMTELLLDNGVRALLRGCTKLRRFAFHVRPGALSDLGLCYIAEFSKTIRYMLLRNAGASDDGLLALARGCPSLQKLELRSCCFSERAIAAAVLQLKSLRYLRVQGYRATPTGSDLMAMARPFWNIEFIAPSQGEPSAEGQAQILAYYSLAGARTDLPHPVIPL